MVGGIQNVLRASVVLFQLDYGGIGKVALEVENNLNVCPAERIDRVVNHNAAGDVVAQARDGEVVDSAVVVLSRDTFDAPPFDAAVRKMPVARGFEDRHHVAFGDELGGEGSVEAPPGVRLHAYLLVIPCALLPPRVVPGFVVISELCLILTAALDRESRLGLAAFPLAVLPGKKRGKDRPGFLRYFFRLTTKEDMVRRDTHGRPFFGVDREHRTYVVPNHDGLYDCFAYEVAAAGSEHRIALFDRLDGDIPGGGQNRRTFYNALIIVADNADVFVLPGKEGQKLILAVVDVLELVAVNILEAVLVVLAGLLRLAQELDRLHNQIVEVQGVRNGQLLLVELVGPTDGAFERGCREVIENIRGRLQRFFGFGDLRKDGAGGELLIIEAQLADSFFDD